MLSMRRDPGAYRPECADYISIAAGSVAQEGLTGVGTRTGGTLQDHRRVHGSSGLHDGLNLLHVVDVEAGRP